MNIVNSIMKRDISGHYAFGGCIKTPTEKLSLATFSTHDCRPDEGARVPNLHPLKVFLASRRYIMQQILRSCCGINVHKSMIKDA